LEICHWHHLAICRVGLRNFHPFTIRVKGTPLAMKWQPISTLLYDALSLQKLRKPGLRFLRALVKFFRGMVTAAVLSERYVAHAEDD